MRILKPKSETNSPVTDDLHGLTSKYPETECFGLRDVNVEAGIVRFKFIKQQHINKMKNTGIYIHIPFCRSKCYYCDFYSLPASGYSTETVDGYVTALERQILLFSEKYGKRISADTVFFGGGTPTLLEARHFEKIFSAIGKAFDLTHNAEITVESNPCTLDCEELTAMRTLGINRLSIGVQSFCDDELKTVGRLHSAKQANDAFFCARKSGFDNIGLDLILGLPGQTRESFLRTSEQAVLLAPEHISVYGLSLEEGTLLYNHRENYCFPDEETCADVFSDTVRYLRENGYSRYEISNFSKEGYQCRHNLHYWHGDEYVGFGVAASSFYNGMRYTSKKDLSAFIRCRTAADFEALCVTEEVLGKEERAREYIMLSLRLSEGFSVNKLKELTRNSDFYLKRCEKYIENGLLVKKSGRIFFSDHGFEVSNSILSEILY